MIPTKISLCLLGFITPVALNASDIDEPLLRPPGAGVVRPGESEFRADGWHAMTSEAQIRWDLGKHYRKGSVEFEMRGPFAQEPKRILFAAWNEEAATDGDRKTQAFLQVRLIGGGMMLRLTHRPGGRSFEKATGPIAWPSASNWVKVKATWDTTGGDSVLWLNGVEIQRGKFNQPFPGLRWVFIGRDNYKRSFTTVAGMTFRNLRVSDLVP